MHMARSRPTSSSAPSARDRPSAWLKDSGLDLVDGVQCDEGGTAFATTGELLRGVHAIGDVAAWRTGEGRWRRREDWTSAQRQGRHVARRLLDLPPLQALDEPDYFWTHQFGRRIQVLGTPRRDAQLVTRSEVPERRAAFHVLEVEGQPVAWISVNSPREFALAMRDSARPLQQRPALPEPDPPTASPNAARAPSTAGPASMCF